MLISGSLAVRWTCQLVPIGWDSIRTTTEDLKLPIMLPELSAGNVVNLFATNAKSGAVFLLAQFRDGTVAKIEPTSAPHHNKRMMQKNSLWM